MALSAQLKGFSHEGGGQWFVFPGHHGEYAFAPPANARDDLVCIPIADDSVIDAERTELYENTLSKFRVTGG